MLYGRWHLQPPPDATRLHDIIECSYLTKFDPNASTRRAKQATIQVKRVKTRLCSLPRNPLR